MALFKSKQLSGSVVLAATASYINPLFISASAAAYGFGSAGSNGYDTIQKEGYTLPQRTKINFAGVGVTVTDDSANDRTTVTISSGGSGSAVLFPYTGSADILGSLSVNGPVVFSSVSDDVFIVKNTNRNLLTISQSGVIIFATQSAELLNANAPVGGMYFTSNSFFVGLET